MAANVTLLEDTAAVPSVPVPLRGTLLFPAEVANVKVPASGPADVGVNAMLTVQLAPTASDVPQELVDWKLDPPVETLTDEICTGTLPVLVRVVVCVEGVEPN